MINDQILDDKIDNIKSTINITKDLKSKYTHIKDRNLAEKEQNEMIENFRDFKEIIPKFSEGTLCLIFSYLNCSSELFYSHKFNSTHIIKGINKTYVYSETTGDFHESNSQPFIFENKNEIFLIQGMKIRTIKEILKIRNSLLKSEE